MHKSAVSEVFLTDSAEAGPDRFLLAAQWPRDHAVFRPGPDGLTDSMVIIETVRQATMLVFHQYYDVPLGLPFVARSFDFEVTDQEALRGAGTPKEATLELKIEMLSDRPGRRRAFRAHTTVHVGAGRPCATVTIGGEILAQALYRRLRVMRATTAGPEPAPLRDLLLAAAPGDVGRSRAKDVVLIDHGLGDHGRWGLRIDPDHATFFDHGSDHVQAVLLMEALRQCGLLTLRSRVQSSEPSWPGVDPVTSLRAEFHSYGEFAPAILLDAEVPATPAPSADRVVEARATQDGQVIAAARLGFRRPALV